MRGKLDYDLFVKEARRLGAREDEIQNLVNLDLREKTPSTERESRATERAETLIRGRGWPTEKIEVFFDHISRSRVISPNAIIIPKDLSENLSESSLVRVVVENMVRARSRGLPGRGLPKNAYLDILREGIVETIAERIMPASRELQEISPLAYSTQELTESLLPSAGMTIDDLERLSLSEAIRALADGRKQSTEDLAHWIENKSKSAYLR